MTSKEFRQTFIIYQSTSLQHFLTRIFRHRAFLHGPKSVVFNWDDGVHNLYLTVGKARLWAMASTAAGIKGQIELTDPANHIAGNFFKAISNYNAISPGIAGLLTHTTK